MLAVLERRGSMTASFAPAIFLEGFGDARSESLQHFVPRSPRPLPAPARPRPLHRIKDAIGIMNLRDRRRAFRAKASAARWMLRVAFKLRDLSGCLIDVGKKPAGRFAVEADGGNEVVMLFDAARPCFSIEFNPLIPVLDRRIREKVAAVAFKIGHC